MELTQKSIPDTICDSNPHTDPVYPHLYCRVWELKITSWDFINSRVLVCFIQWKDFEWNENMREGSSDFSSFNTSGPAPMEYTSIFLEHQGIGGCGLLGGRRECGFRSSYCSYYPEVIPPSSLCSFCPSSALVMNYFKR